MGLGHLFGLDGGGERWLCHDCGRIVEAEREGDGAEVGGGVEGGEGAGAPPTCPECGSTDLEPLALL